MNTFWGSLLHQLSTSNKEHLIWFGAVIVILITLAVLHHKWKDDDAFAFHLTTPALPPES